MINVQLLHWIYHWSPCRFCNAFTLQQLVCNSWVFRVCWLHNTYFSLPRLQIRLPVQWKSLKKHLGYREEPPWTAAPEHCKWSQPDFIIMDDHMKWAKPKQIRILSRCHLRWKWLTAWLAATERLRSPVHTYSDTWETLTLNIILNSMQSDSSSNIFASIWNSRTKSPLEISHVACRSYFFGFVLFF